MRVSQILFCLAGLAVAAPHSGMIDTAELRDVGVIHTGADYKGTSQFLLENRMNNTCYPLNVDVNDMPQGIACQSCRICREAACTFFTGANCTNYSVAVSGPGDVPAVNTPGGNLFLSYSCGQGAAAAIAATADFTLTTVPHDPKAGMQ